MAEHSPLDSSPEGAARAREGPILVLVAEHEEPLRDALVALIDGEADLKLVGVAMDADAAVAMARRTVPDVILQDVRIPGGGGLPVALDVVSDVPHTHVIALSAYEDRASVLSMLHAGAIGYLVKGTTPEEILDATRRAARGQASLSGEMVASVVADLAREIDERRHAELAAAGEAQYFRALLDSAPDAAVVIDQAGTIVLVNQQAANLFGYARDGLIGNPIETLLPPRWRERHIARRAGYFADPRTRPMGLGLMIAGLRSDGTEFPIDISLSAIDTGAGRLATAHIRDITERDLAADLAERRTLLANLVEAGEAERQRIAADIHDDSIQVLAAARMRLQILKGELVDPEHVALLDKLGETIELSIGRLRHLLFELHPPVLDQDGLSAALRVYLDQTEQRSAMRYLLDDRLADQPPPPTRLILYRMVQEALTKLRKHTKAPTIRVLLDGRDGGTLVRITDDGRDPLTDPAMGPAPGRLGLTATRERAELAGGWLRIASTPQSGTTIEFWIPSLPARSESVDLTKPAQTDSGDPGLS